jgi:hypothetical protein
MVVKLFAFPGASSYCSIDKAMHQLNEGCPLLTPCGPCPIPPPPPLCYGVSLVPAGLSTY